jgi:hypothetical protein
MLNTEDDTSFEVLTGVRFPVGVFWAVTPCIVVGYQRFEGPCCLHLQWAVTPCSVVIGREDNI